METTGEFMRRIMATAALSLALAACGGDASSDSDGTEPAQQTVAGDSAPALDGGPDWLRPIPEVTEADNTLGGMTGILRGITASSTEQVLEFYAGVAESEGMEVVERSDTELRAEADAPVRSLVVHVDPARAPEGEVWVRVGYTDYS